MAVHHFMDTLPSPPRLWAVTIASLTFFQLAAGTEAILIRHDRDDAQYRAEPAHFPFLAEVAAAQGTLIAPDWIITSAHVAEGVSPVSGTVRIAGRELRVRRIVFHPTWIGDLPPGLAEPEWVDLAMIQLAAPLTDVIPAQLYTGDDEDGQEVMLVGRGQTGDGRTGPRLNDRKLRVATNIVSRTDHRLLYFAFDAPPDGTRLEGIGGPGDSGGPALMSKGDVVFVLGVCYRNDGQGNDDVAFRYGTSDVYVRLSTHLGWICRILSNAMGDTIWHSVADAGWPNGELGEAAEQYFSAFASGSRDRMIAYEMKWRAKESLRGLSAEIRAEKWLTQFRRWRTLVPVYWHQPTPSMLVILARSGGQWRSVRLEMQGPVPRRVREIVIARERETDIPG